jgi:hypothetical protein
MKRSAPAACLALPLLLLGPSFAGEAPDVSPAAEPAGETEPAPGRLTDLIRRAADKVAEKGGESPALSAEERLARDAELASRYARPLPMPVAIGVTVIGLVLMLFGRRLFRAGIVLYLAACLGLVGYGVGETIGDEGHPLWGMLAGAVAGAALSLPLRALAGSLIGALTGAILASVVAQSLTSDWTVTLIAAGGGLVVSSVLTFFYPAPLLTVGFALFGAAAASVGVLSIATEPVDGHLAYGPWHVAGVVLAALLGVLFQSRMREPADDG